MGDAGKAALREETRSGEKDGRAEAGNAGEQCETAGWKEAGFVSGGVARIHDAVSVLLAGLRVQSTVCAKEDGDRCLTTCCRRD